MGGFVLNLKSKVKKSSKKKRGNVFGDEDQGKKRTKIKLTHVEEYKEKPEEKLVIKPASLKTSFYDTEKDATLQKSDQPDLDARPKYGLMMMEGKQEHIKGESTLKVIEDTSSLPEITKEEEYENVPVEEFGEALLRGMGWNGQDEHLEANSTYKPPGPRPQFLGIGAKVLLDHAAIKKRDKENSYMPVVRIDRQSGKRIE
ncbi:SPP2 (YOR148C) [Zygosaccharomyces parabailii]|nr:SPP2 (YOR148C) [Zygosaccharomyces parabailii]